MVALFGKMNGWQRLCFVATCLAFLASLWTAYTFVYGYKPSEWDYRRKIEADLASDKCTAYTRELFAKLPKPEFGSGGTCWHIYTHRRYASNPDRLPFTLETYDRDSAEYKLDEFLKGLSFLLAATLVCSGLVYLSGWVLAWIIRGFRKPSEP